MKSEVNYERTIDLVSFLKAVFVRWRQMVILGIICALFLGMIPIYEYKTEQKKDVSSSEESTDTDKYITLEEYNASLKDLEDKLNSKKQYLIHSVLMKIDPFDQIRAREYVYVDLILEEKELEELNGIDELLSVAAEADESEVTETDQNSDTAESESGFDGEAGANAKIRYLLSRVMGDYESFINTRIDWQQLADKLGIDGIYLKECVTIEVSPSKAMITICVKGYDEEMAAEIRDYVVEKILEEHDTVQSRFCEHELVLQDGGIEHIYDNTMRNYQENFVSELATTQTRYDNFKSAKSDYVYDAPVGTSLNKKDVLIHAIAGFIGGFAIAFAISAILVFAGGKVISAKELALSYDLKALTVIHSPGKKKFAGFVDDWIENIGLGEEKKLSEDERYQKAAQMAELYALNAGKLTVTGDVDTEVLKKVTEHLQKYLSNIRLVYCDTLLGHTSELRESDGVILVEKKNASRMSEVETDLGLIGDMKLPVIGVVLL